MLQPEEGVPLLLMSSVALLVQASLLAMFILIFMQVLICAASIP